MCQSPIYRDTHFYVNTDGYLLVKKSRVNPLSIGTPISTLALTGYLEIIKKALCQSPIYRDTHFYIHGIVSIIYGAVCVNPLSIGTPISTLTLKIA